MDAHETEADCVDKSEEEDVLEQIPAKLAHDQQPPNRRGPMCFSVPLPLASMYHDLDDFVLGWGLHCIAHSVSRCQYSEQLQPLKFIGPNEKVRKLPGSLHPLKKRVREIMPYMELRVAPDLALDPKKLSSSRQRSATLTGMNPAQDLSSLTQSTCSVESKGRSSPTAWALAKPNGGLALQAVGRVHSNHQATLPFIPGPRTLSFLATLVATSSTPVFYTGQAVVICRPHPGSSRTLGLLGGPPNPVIDQVTDGDMVAEASAGARRYRWRPRQCRARRGGSCLG